MWKQAAWQSSVVGNLRLSLFHFTHVRSKVDGSDLEVAGFLAGCGHLMRTLYLIFGLCNQ